MSCPFFDARALGALARFLAWPALPSLLTAHAAQLAELSRHNARAAAAHTGEPQRGASAEEIAAAARALSGSDRTALRSLAHATAHGLAYTMPDDAPRSALRALCQMLGRLLVE